MKNIVIHPADRWACGTFRVIQRGQVWNKFIAPGIQNESVVIDTERYFHDIALNQYNIKVCLTQRQFYKQQIESMNRYKNHGIIIINDLDDMLWQVPTTNPFAKVYNGEVRKNLKESVQTAHFSTVSTIPLKEEVKKFTGKDSFVIPNMLEDEWYVEPHVRKNEKLKVLWTGSSTHHGDLNALIKVVTFLEDKVDFIFMGALPNGITEEKYSNVGFVKGVDFDKYRRTLVKLSQEVDVAIVPLEPCRFNECKSNLKMLEMGAVGLPVVTSDIYPYQDSVRKVKWSNKQHKDWIDILLEYSNNETLRMNDSNISYEYAKKFKCSLPENIEYVKNLFNDALNLT